MKSHAYTSDGRNANDILEELNQTRAALQLAEARLNKMVQFAGSDYCPHCRRLLGGRA